MLWRERGVVSCSEQYNPFACSHPMMPCQNQARSLPGVTLRATAWQLCDVMLEIRDVVVCREEKKMQAPANLPASAGASTRKAFSSSRPSTFLTNTAFTSMPSTLGSADQNCTWFNRTSDELTALERRSPWPCVLPPARAGRYVRIRFHLPRNSATYHCVDAMWLTVNVAPEGKFTSPHSQVHITRHYSKVQCHLR
jgi:hypothetical protein